MRGSAPTSLRRGLFFNGGAAAASMGFLFVETTVSARLLPAESYGVYVVMITVVNFFVMAVDAGCKTAVAQVIARSDQEQRAALVNSTLLLRGAILVVVSILLWMGGQALTLFEATRSVAPYTMQLPFMLFVASFDQLLLGMLQGFRAYGALATAQMLRGGLRLAFTVVFLAVLHFGLAGLIYSWIGSFTCSVVFQFVCLPVRKRLTFRRDLVGEMLRLGGPLQVSGFLTFMFGRVQVFLLGTLAGPASVAYYAVAARIPEALQQLTESYLLVYFPTMTALLAAGKRDEARRMLARSLRLVSLGAGVVALTGVVFSDQIVRLIFSERYAASSPAFAVLLVSLQIGLLGSMLGYTLVAAGRTGRSLLADATRTAVSVVGCLALIPFFGFQGAAWSNLMGAYAANPVSLRMLGPDLVRVSAYAKQTGLLLVCAGLYWWLRPADGVVRAAIVLAFAGLSAWLSGFSVHGDLGLAWTWRKPRSAGVP